MEEGDDEEDDEEAEHKLRQRRRDQSCTSYCVKGLCHCCLVLPPIDPTSPRKVFFDCIMGALIIYSVLVVPVQIAFDPPQFQDTVSPEFAFEWMVDCFFAIDICIQFNTAFVDSETQQLELDKTAIASNYVRGWFPIDFLSTFPFDKVLGPLITSLASGGGSAMRLPRMLRLLRLVRLMKLARVLKLGNLLDAMEESGYVSAGTIRLTSMFVGVFYAAHLLGCVWFFFPSFFQPADDYNNPPWLVTYCDKFYCGYRADLGGEISSMTVFFKDIVCL
jgi:hypothetical protein